jgi:hypothetical protein
MSDSDDTFRVISWNIEHNGTDRTGERHRWYTAMDVLTRLKPHIVLRQELTGAAHAGGRALWAEARRLGGDGPAFIPYLAPATAESPNPTGVYLDPSLCEPTEYFEHVTGMWHPICNPVIRLKGAPLKLSLASFHLCSYDGDARAREARRLTTLGKPGMAALIGGDCNSYAHRDGSELQPLPDWSQITDRSHLQHRTIDCGDHRVCDVRPDEILAGERDGGPPVFKELGHYAAAELGQDKDQALAPTASLWRHDQGPAQRIDRLYATPQIADALVRLDVDGGDEVREASDHALVMATFSLHRLRQALSTRAESAA